MAATLDFCVPTQSTSICDYLYFAFFFLFFNFRRECVFVLSLIWCRSKGMKLSFKEIHRRQKWMKKKMKEREKQKRIVHIVHVYFAGEVSHICVYLNCGLKTFDRHHVYHFFPRYPSFIKKRTAH